MSAWIHPDWAQQQRLVLALVAALGLHLLILGLIKLPVPRITPPAPSMALQWVELPARKPRSEQVVPMNKPARPATRRGQDAPFDRGNKATPGKAAGVSVTQTIAPQPKTEFTVPAPLNPADLRATARSLAREMAREQGADAAVQQDDPANRPILPQLDQALRKPHPGVQRYEGGLVKIITAGGRIYCMQEQPNFARGGPADALSVPTNCP